MLYRAGQLCNGFAKFLLDWVKNDLTDFTFEIESQIATNELT